MRGNHPYFPKDPPRTDLSVDAAIPDVALRIIACPSCCC